MIQVGVIGYGYWGPQIARNFHSLEDCEVSVICDKKPGRSRANPAGLSASARNLRRFGSAMFAAH